MNKGNLAKIIIAGALLLPIAALAVDAGTPPAGGLNISGLYNAIKIAAWSVFAIVALVMFVIAGSLFLTAAGSPEKIQQARQAFLWGIAGVVVAIIAYSALTLVGSLLGQ